MKLAYEDTCDRFDSLMEQIEQLLQEAGLESNVWEERCENFSDDINDLIEDNFADEDDEDDDDEPLAQDGDDDIDEDDEED